MVAAGHPAGMTESPGIGDKHESPWEGSLVSLFIVIRVIAGACSIVGVYMALRSTSLRDMLGLQAHIVIRVFAGAGSIVDVYMACVVGVYMAWLGFWRIVGVYMVLTMQFVIWILQPTADDDPSDSEAVSVILS